MIASTPSKSQQGYEELCQTVIAEIITGDICLYSDIYRQYTAIMETLKDPAILR